MERGYQVIVAEDHIRFREEIKKILGEMPEIQIIGEVGEGIELFELLATCRPDLILLDISMPNLRAMKATQEIKSRYPGVKVIIMVMDKEEEYLSHAMAAGADGILLKQNTALDLGSAIQRMRQGQQYFPNFGETPKIGVEPVKSKLFHYLVALPSI